MRSACPYFKNYPDNNLKSPYLTKYPIPGSMFTGIILKRKSPVWVPQGGINSHSVDLAAFLTEYAVFMLVEFENGVLGSFEATVFAPFRKNNDY